MASSHMPQPPASSADAVPTPNVQPAPDTNPASPRDAYKIALVTDWLTTPGGAEKVLLELHKMYPDAPIYTSQYRPKKLDWFNGATVKTGWLNIFPACLRKILGPLRQIYFSHLDLSHYDLVISVTGAEAKSVRCESKPYRSKSDATHEIILPPPHRATHLCYCHVPTQYYWQLYDQYVEDPGFGFFNPVVRFFFKLFVKPLKKADYAAAQKPDEFITISQYAAYQIQKYYGRSSVIIAPPVDVETFSSPISTDLSTEKSTETPTFSAHNSTRTKDLSTTNPQQTDHLSTSSPQKTPTFSTKSPDLSTTFPQDIHNPTPVGTAPTPTNGPSASAGNLPAPDPSAFVIACRQVTWKRVDLAIQACLDKHQPLYVIGDGPEHKKLLALANNSNLIHFLPWLSSRELANYLQHSRAYLFPSLEPFGIAAVEALAAGCPVIAYSEGGSRDFVIPGENGLLFSDQTAASLASALDDFDHLHLNPATITHSAEPFSASHFRQKISDLVAEKRRQQPKSVTTSPTFTQPATTSPTPTQPISAPSTPAQPKDRSDA